MGQASLPTAPGRWQWCGGGRSREIRVRVSKPFNTYILSINKKKLLNTNYLEKKI